MRQEYRSRERLLFNLVNQHRAAALEHGRIRMVSSMIEPPSQKDGTECGCNEQCADSESEAWHLKSTSPLKRTPREWVGLGR